MILALGFVPHVLPPGGLVQVQAGNGRTTWSLGAGAAYDLPFSATHDVWKFQAETGIDRYLRDPFRGLYVGGRALGMVWTDTPYIGGDHLGVKALIGHRWTGDRWTASVGGGLVGRLYLGERGEGHVLFPGEVVLPTAEVTFGAMLRRHQPRNPRGSASRRFI